MIRTSPERFHSRRGNASIPLFALSCPRIARRAALPVLVGADTTFTCLHVRVLLSKVSAGRRYLIGTEGAKPREYFRMVGELADVPTPSINLSERLLIPLAEGLEKISQWTGVRPALPVDIPKTTATGSLLFDGSRAVKELGQCFTPLRIALSEVVDEILQAKREAVR